MKDLNLATILEKLQRFSATLKKYSILLFMLFLLGIYGFIVWRISVLSNVQPSDDAISAKLQSTHPPKIDQSVVDKIQQLKDNSVNVQTLFDTARDNPFQE